MPKDEEKRDQEDPAIEEVRNLERARLRALVEADMKVAYSLHADDFELITVGGGRISKDEYLGDISSGDIDYLVWEPDSEIRVRLYGQMAVVRYSAQIEIMVRGQKHVTRAWHTDSYEKRNGHWQAVWSHATGTK